MSVRQGNLLENLIERARLPWNEAFGGGPVMVPPDGPLPRLRLEGGAVLTLLSPTSEVIGNLSEYWKQSMATTESTPSLSDEPQDDEDESPEPERSVAADLRKGRGKVLEGQLESAVDVAASINVEKLALAPFLEDRSMANGSSIAFLAEIEGRSLLIGGDAHSRVLAQSIKRLLIERITEGHLRLRISLFVVPRGGARTAVSRELLELIECERYVFSASSGRFRRPQQEAVARILMFGGTRPRLIFNYRSPENSVWADKELQARYRYDAIYPEEGSAGIKIRL